MTRPFSDHRSAQPWSVPVALTEVPVTGRHFDLSADEHTRAAIAKRAGLRALSRLQAAFDAAPRGHAGLRVIGRVSATVGQTCVVTLEPIENEIEEDIDLVFAPAAAPSVAEPAAVQVANDDAPEALAGDAIDLGAIAVEFLILGIDPYPRKPGVVFEQPPSGDDSARPFAALATLKRGQGSRD